MEQETWHQTQKLWLPMFIQYLAGTKSYGITYSNSPSNTTNNPNNFYGFADATFTNQDDFRSFKSTSAYVFMASGRAMTWRFKKQTTVTLSSTEAKYVALTEAVTVFLMSDQLPILSSDILLHHA